MSNEPETKWNKSRPFKNVILDFLCVIWIPFSIVHLMLNAICFVNSVFRLRYLIFLLLFVPFAYVTVTSYQCSLQEYLAICLFDFFSHSFIHYFIHHFPFISKTRFLLVFFYFCLSLAILFISALFIWYLSN